MKITNHAGLPDAIVQAVANDPYTKGESDISVTGLVGPVQINFLRNKFDHLLEEDAITRIWSLLGQAVHVILERAEQQAVTEERLYATLHGWTISGQFDRLVLDKQNVLQDYKVTSVWTAINGVKPEWVAQLNCLAWLCRRNNIEIDKLQVVAIYRDWSRAQVDRNPDYPRQALEIINIPMWKPQQVASYLSARILAHQEASETGVVAFCSDEERWYRGEKWAVMKKGRKSALRLLDSEKDAYFWCVENGHGEFSDPHAATLEYDQVELKKGITVECRPGTYARCEHYCPVASVCPQWTEQKVVP